VERVGEDGASIGARIARYEQKSEEGRSGVQRAKRERKRQNEGERPRGA
jgi:hypothetical protein